MLLLVAGSWCAFLPACKRPSSRCYDDQCEDQRNGRRGGVGNPESSLSTTISAQKLQTLEPDAMAGLSAQEATKRLSQFGANTVPGEHDHWLIMIGRHFWAPVPWMLEATIVLQFAIGKSVEAMLITGLLIFNVTIGVFQKSRANAALELLKSRLFSKARSSATGTGPTCQRRIWFPVMWCGCRSASSSPPTREFCKVRCRSISRR